MARQVLAARGQMGRDCLSVWHRTLGVVLLRSQCFRASPLFARHTQGKVAHNGVQSLMAQGSQFPLRKPPGFHYDFFLLGITTLIAGLLGLPAPNGLIPQAPIHTASLTVLGRPESDKRDEELRGEKGYPVKPSAEVPISVVEQRVSNLAQGTLCLVLLTGPFLHVLHLIPRGVLAGLL